MLKVFISSFLFSIILLSSCSYFSFSTNLDPENFTQYQKEVNLKTYSKNELIDLDYLDLGTVEGVSCQAEENDQRANINEAKNIIREKALKKEANGIVYSKCFDLENTPGCITSVSCYARIIYVKEDD